MSSGHAELHDVMGRWVLEDLDSKNGTRLNGVPVKRAALSDGDAIEIGHTFFLFRREVTLGPDSPPVLASSELIPSVPGQVTIMPALASQLAALVPIARSAVSVVIQGESGTGKELMARVIHELSGRTGTFVAVNCAAIPQTLLEAELFGYQKGAFSGAIHNHAGLIRNADKGTLFLDEIADLPSQSQVSLLRVLQEHQVLPLGKGQPVSVDVRVCAATHRDLTHLVTAQQIREDFFARISGYTFLLPALRHRREDLGLIIAAILKRLAPETAQKLTFERKAARALFLYSWPLNIRELEKCLEAAIALAAKGPIAFEHLPAAVQAAGTGASTASASSPQAATPNVAEEEMGREKLIELLTQHHGNISAVARSLGKARIQVRRWLARYLVDPERYRKPRTTR
jgi:transcriptional regulator with GAF, ATPase, and Fis domain